MARRKVSSAESDCRMSAGTAKSASRSPRSASSVQGAETPLAADEPVAALFALERGDDEVLQQAVRLDAGGQAFDAGGVEGGARVGFGRLNGGKGKGGYGHGSYSLDGGFNIRWAGG